MNARHRVVRGARLFLPLLLIIVAGACTPPSDDRRLGISVRGSVSVQPTEFSGYFIYEDSDGNVVQRQISGSGNFNEIVQGRKMRQATVRRTSQQGVIGLVVTADGDIIFDSGMLQTNDMIIYKAPAD